MSSPRPHKRRKIASGDSPSMPIISQGDQSVLELVRAHYAASICDLVENYLQDSSENMNNILNRLIYISPGERVDLVSYLHKRFTQFHADHWLTIYVDILNFDEREQFIYRQFLPSLTADFKSLMRKISLDEYIYLGSLAQANGQNEKALEYFDKLGILAREAIDSYSFWSAQKQSGVQYHDISFKEAYSILYSDAVSGKLWSLNELAELYLGKLEKLSDHQGLIRSVVYGDFFEANKDLAVEILNFIQLQKPILVDELNFKVDASLVDLMLDGSGREEPRPIQSARMTYQSEWFFGSLTKNIAMVSDAFDEIYLNYSMVPEVVFYLVIAEPRILVRQQFLNIINNLNDDDKKKFTEFSKKNYVEIIDACLWALFHEENSLEIILSDSGKTSEIFSNILSRFITIDVVDQMKHENWFPRDHRGLVMLIRKMFDLRVLLPDCHAKINAMLVNLMNCENIANDPVCIHHLLMLALTYPGIMDENIYRRVRNLYQAINVKCIDLQLSLCNQERPCLFPAIISNLNSESKYMLANLLDTTFHNSTDGIYSLCAFLPVEILAEILSYVLGRNFTKAFLNGDILYKEVKKERLARGMLIDLQARVSGFSPSAGNMQLFAKVNNALALANNGMSSHKKAYDDLKREIIPAFRRH